MRICCSFFIPRRECNSQHGTFECWQKTTDGFAYGLSTAMIDYCQVVIELRRMNNPSWYNISREILSEQITKYNLDGKVRQLTRNDIEQVSLLILNKVKTERERDPFIDLVLHCFFSVSILHHCHRLPLNHHVHHVLFDKCN